ncbi:hypothetical protein BC332_09521 [Capsicum chinense]|nr:hypothetical protein BC332_09521 [Capsicum chinense]
MMKTNEVLELIGTRGIRASRILEGKPDILLCSLDGNSSPDGHRSPNETDKKRLGHSYQSKTFNVEINFVVKISMQAIANALRGQESENSQEALRVGYYSEAACCKASKEEYEASVCLCGIQVCRGSNLNLTVGSSSMSIKDDSFSDLLLFAGVFEAEFTSFSTTES